MASLSFHETKNFVCGEGGALLLNDARDVDRARVLYDKGTDRRAFLLGQVDKYSWRDTGSSFGMSDALAAYLTGQLEQAETIQAKRRRRVRDATSRLLAEPAAELGLRLPVVPADCDPAWHLFYVLMPDHDTRTRVMAQLREEGIQTTFHYVPLHSSDGGRRFAAREVDCPVTTDVSGRLVRLPFHNNLSEADAVRVVESLVRATARGTSDERLDRPAGLLVVPRPGRPARGGAGRVPRLPRPPARRRQRRRAERRLDAHRRSAGDRRRRPARAGPRRGGLRVGARAAVR